MRRSLPGWLVAALAWLLLTSAVRAQNAPAGKDAKSEPGKTAVKEAKPTEVAPPRMTLDKLKLPADAIVIVIEKLQEAAELIPRAIHLSPEKFQELQERIRQLELQLKADKVTTHSCKLTGKLEGDYVAMRAEFTFSTQQPKVSVVLGLQGAHLIDEGELDKSTPQLDYGDDGFTVRVEREGAHHLALNLKVPLSMRRTTGLGTIADRGFDLGLPGAPATTLSLELPTGVKEVRVNDVLKKNKTSSRWDLPLGLSKQVTVAWKEPLMQTGNGPLPTLESQIVAKIEDTGVQIQADLVLEDLRGQAKEWRLLLPAGAQATVKTLPAAAYQWILPDGKNPYHVLQLKEPAAERFTVAVQARMARSPAKLPVGPFVLAGALRQQGTILVQSTPEAVRGQRLVYHRFGAITQREVPKNQSGLDNLALFHFALTGNGSAMSKAPLELEFKANTGLAETQADHTVRLKGGDGLWYVETTTRIQAKSLAEIADDLDVYLPRYRIAGLESLASVPAAAFPAALAWARLVPAEGRVTWGLPLEFRWEEEGSDVALPDGSRRARVKWSRSAGKPLTVTLHGKYAVPKDSQRVRIELPRPLGMLDRGGSLAVSSGSVVELLTGPSGAEEPVPERHQWKRQTETAPATVDLAWRTHQPVFPVTALVDVTLHDRSAQVRQHLLFTSPSGLGAAPSGNLRLRVPTTLGRVKVDAGGKMLSDPQADTGLTWVAVAVDAAGKCDLVLEYDVPLPKGDEGGGPRTWELPLIWPEGATRHEAKVRVWCAPGAVPEIGADALDWHQRGLEIVAGRDSLPALVVQGVGLRLPLTVQPRPVGQTTLAALLCDRALLQVHVDDEGNQFYRARFLVRKLAARQLNLELPVPVRDNLLAVRLGPDKQDKALPWHDPAWNVATISLPAELPNFQTQQVFLEVEYKLPSSFADGRRLGQTLLFPPRWHGDAVAGTVRWQIDLPDDQVAIVVGTGATLDYRWAFHGWLAAPEPSVTSADLEAWLTGREGAEPTPVGLAYWRPGLAVQRLIHLPRQGWLLVCSGLVLAVGLALLLLPLPRWLLWLVASILVAGAIAAALLLPALAPPLLYGSQPGLAVLAVLLGLQWLLQERYRRQVVFMPGFARLQPGSSISRAGQAAKPREPSTVDAPSGAVPSSVK